MHTGSADSPFQILVEHFDRCFAAEEENSRRHRETARMVVTAIIAFLAVGLFRFGLEMSGGAASEGTWLADWVRGFFILGLLSLFWSFSYLIGPRFKWRRRRLEKVEKRYRTATASHHLMPTDDIFEGLVDPTPGTADFVRLQAAERLQAAAQDLARRNSFRQAGIQLSQRWFAIGIFAIVLGVLCHIASSQWYSGYESTRNSQSSSVVLKDEGGKNE